MPSLRTLRSWSWTFRHFFHFISLPMQRNSKSDHLNFQTMSNNRFWLQLRSLPSRWKHSENPPKKYPLLYFSFKLLFISSKNILPAKRGARATSQLQLQRPPQWPCSWVGCPWGSHLHNRRHCISIIVITSINVIILASITLWSLTFNIIKNHTAFKHLLSPQHQQFKFSKTQRLKYWDVQKSSSSAQEQQQQWKNLASCPVQPSTGCWIWSSRT